MTTGDEEADSLVDNLFREVDDHFKDLEREYQQARQGLVAADSERLGHPVDPLEASNERFELMSEVATLRAEVSRQADELDERDRMLAELGDRIAGFEAQIASGNADTSELQTARQQVLGERREQQRLKAMLDARQAERQELAEVTHRLQNDKEHVEDLLKTALARFEEVEGVRDEMSAKVADLEAAHKSATRAHESRAHELIEARSEAVQLAAQVDDLTSARAEAEGRANQAEGVAERRASEAAYLNRRIEAMTEKLDAATGLEAEVARLQRQNTLVERRVTELARELAAQVAETKGSAAAVEALAARASVHDELVARIAQLEAALAEARKAASAPPAASENPDFTVSVPAASSGEVQTLAERARELGTRRANQRRAEVAERTAAAVPRPPIEFDGTESPEQVAAVVAAPDQTAEVPTVDFVDTAETQGELYEPAEPAAAEAPVDDPAANAAALVDGAAADATAGPASFEGTESATGASDIDPTVPSDSGPIGTDELDDDDLGTDALESVDEAQATAESVGDDPESIDEAWVAAESVGDHPESVDEAQAAAESVGDEWTSEVLPLTEGDVAPEAPIIPAAPPAPAAPPPAAPPPAAPPPAASTSAAPTLPPPPPPPAPEAAEAATADPPESTWESSPIDASAVIIATAETVPQFELAIPSSPTTRTSTPGAVAFRKRTVLPADLAPNTPEAIDHLLSQVGVVAIVDARSTCARTGIRPSELFERLAGVRDRFDLPIEVVVTPVSTPVGGAPQLPAIGVHKVEGADTVADRIRALCMGFPPDQPIVVIAGDDHVRRAAIGEEANVIEPAAILDIAAR